MNYNDEHPEASPWANLHERDKSTAEERLSSPTLNIPQLEDAENQDAQSQQQFQPHSEAETDAETRPLLSSSSENAQHQAVQHPERTDSQAPLAHTSRSAQSTRIRPEKASHKLQVKITELERNGRKDPVFVFDVYTNMPRFRTTQYRNVRRTHTEFTRLAEHLMSANPEALVPSVPASTTSAGAGTEEDDTKTRLNMQRWFNVVCANTRLIHDDETLLFVESDFGYSPVLRRRQPATGMRRKVLKQFAPPPDDNQELAEARPVVKRLYLATMDAGQKVDNIVKSRRALGLAESNMGLTLAQLSPQEIHAGLSIAYRKLGATIRTVGDFHLAQGTFEASSLSDPLQYFSDDAFVVKETLTNRQILMRDLIAAGASTHSKCSAADRLRSSSTVKRDKVDDAIASLEEAKRHEEELREKCTVVTSSLLVEHRRWFDRTSLNISTSIREYIIRQIEAERRVLATLESVRPDIRNIDTTGGLSRLGREHHPTIRKTPLASSQGAKGDAWSGVQRRSDGVRRADGTDLSGLPVLEETEIDEALASPRTSSKSTGLKGLVEEDDEDRVDARNAASRLAQSMF